MQVIAIKYEISLAVAYSKPTKSSNSLVAYCMLHTCHRRHRYYDRMYPSTVRNHTGCVLDCSSIGVHLAILARLMRSESAEISVILHFQICWRTKRILVDFAATVTTVGIW